MAGTGTPGLRSIADPFLAPAPTGVSVRHRLKDLTPGDEAVLRAVGAHLGSLASTDLASRCADGTGHGKDSWAARKRELTPQSSSRWAGAITKASTEQWALARGAVGVDANADHLAAWRLETHGNPVGDPHRFELDLSGSASHRDAQVRHALFRLLRWATGCGVHAITVEGLDFAADKSREKHGRRKRFRQLISGFPTARLRSRLVSMAHTLGVAVIAVDPAYTFRWGAQDWRKPLTTKRRKVSRHDAASIAVGRRAQGRPVRRRTAPPPHHRSDGAGHRTAQAAPGSSGREELRRPVTERAHDARRRTGTAGTRRTSASNTVGDAPVAQVWVQDSTPGHC